MVILSEQVPDTQQIVITFDIDFLNIALIF